MTLLLAGNGAAPNPQRVREDAGDAIHIERLEISARVGVPDEERAEPQRLVVCLTIWPKRGFDDLADELGNAVNYAAVAREVREFVASRNDKLIETLAGATARYLLSSFSIRAVRLELRKFVIPGSEYVAVIITRGRDE